MHKKKYVIFAFFIFLVFALLTFQSVKEERAFLDILVYPLKILEQASSAVTRTVRNTFNTYIMIVGKERENKELLEEIHRLEEEKNRCLEAESENKRLRKLLRLRSERPDHVATAEVFARDPTNWFQVLWINKGSDDGITRDMVAVTHHGPVGRVRRVLKERSNIMLITDVNSSIAVRLQSSRIEGILEGRGDDRCNLKYISREADVEVGEKVVTSGLDGIYPEGFLVGFVKDVQKDAEEVFQIIEVVPSQELNKIEEVAILER